MIGTMLLTILVGNYLMIQNYNNKVAIDPRFESVDSGKTGLILGMFTITMFSARISGSHFNPCITLAYVLREMKTGSFKPLLAVIYILSQTLGAILGAAVCFIYRFGSDDHFAGPLIAEKPLNIVLEIPGESILRHCVLEIMAAFFLTFMYLTSTVQSTKFTNDAAIQTIILSSSYYTAMHLAGIDVPILSASPVNPAISFGFTFWDLVQNTKDSVFFVLIPFGGSVLSFFFFQYIYIQTKETADDAITEDDDLSNQEALLDD